MDVPRTQIEAFDKIKPEIQGMKNRIYQYILWQKQNNNIGCTNSDLRFLFDSEPGTISARLRELVKDGLIENSGKTKINKKHKTNQIIWTISNNWKKSNWTPPLTNKEKIKFISQQIDKIIYYSDLPNEIIELAKKVKKVCEI